MHDLSGKTVNYSFLDQTLCRAVAQQGYNDALKWTWGFRTWETGAQQHRT
jgi:hypothetical protein